MEQGKKIKTVIIILAVLLGLSVSALCGVLIYNRLSGSAPAAVTVPDNLITPNGDTPQAEVSENNPSAAAAASAVQSGGGDTQNTEKAATIELYNRQPEENTPFKAENMFPGDSATKYYRVRVSYHGNVTVRYKAQVRAGYEKLAEVMKIRVKLLSSGETLYDGGIADMPESLQHKLTSEKSDFGELYYEITAYLDTGVGNEYQNKALIADFKWWVEETENLEAPPKTGDTSGIAPWALLSIVSGGAMLFLLALKRREEKSDD